MKFYRDRRFIRWWPVIILLFALGLNHYDYVVWSLIVLILPALVCLYYHRNNLKKIILSNIFKVIIFTVLFFIINRLIAPKIINYIYQVDPQYLSDSPIILAIPITTTIIFAVLSLSAFIIAMIQPIRDHYWRRFKKFFLKENDNKYSQLDYTLDSCIFLFVFFLLLAYVSIKAYEITLDYVLLADAYPSSDCGLLMEDYLYIRKNQNECYRLTNPLTASEYEIVSVVSPR